MKVTLAILTLNEIAGLKKIFKQINKEILFEIFAIDGGSTDGTIDFFHQNNIPVFKQNKKGRGEAFRMAFRNATGDCVLFFSPDGNEDPEDIPKFVNRLEEGYDLVIGNRMSNGGTNEEDHQIFRWRKWANLTFSILANITWNRSNFLWDTINGYRAITKKAWSKIEPDGEGYAIEYQISIRSLKQGLNIKEIPTKEGSRIDDDRCSASISTGLAMLKMYFKELKEARRWNKCETKIYSDSA